MPELASYLKLDGLLRRCPTEPSIRTMAAKSLRQKWESGLERDVLAFVSRWDRTTRKTRDDLKALANGLNTLGHFSRANKKGRRRTSDREQYHHALQKLWEYDRRQFEDDLQELWGAAVRIWDPGSAPEATFIDLVEGVVDAYVRERARLAGETHYVPASFDNCPHCGSKPSRIAIGEIYIEFVRTESEPSVEEPPRGGDGPAASRQPVSPSPAAGSGGASVIPAWAEALRTFVTSIPTGHHGWAIPILVWLMSLESPGHGIPMTPNLWDEADYAALRRGAAPLVRRVGDLLVQSEQSRVVEIIGWLKEAGAKMPAGGVDEHFVREAFIGILVDPLAEVIEQLDLAEQSPEQEREQVSWHQAAQRELRRDAQGRHDG